MLVREVGLLALGGFFVAGSVVDALSEKPRITTSESEAIDTCESNSLVSSVVCQINRTFRNKIKAFQQVLDELAEQKYKGENIELRLGTLSVATAYIPGLEEQNHLSMNHVTDESEDQKVDKESLPGKFASEDDKNAKIDIANEDGKNEDHEQLVKHLTDAIMEIDRAGVAEWRRRRRYRDAAETLLRKAKVALTSILATIPSVTGVFLGVLTAIVSIYIWWRIWKKEQAVEVDGFKQG